MRKTSRPPLNEKFPKTMVSECSPEMFSKTLKAYLPEDSSSLVCFAVLLLGASSCIHPKLNMYHHFVLVLCIYLFVYASVIYSTIKNYKT